ncbi:MAG: type II toxin-antitoxin system RelE/ParE family toxin [Mariprofundaceae bacterium]|nr:type II toxin-antitoxin system RelE/ParE family toxin [Mariprofundaceae bacterium]
MGRQPQYWQAVADTALMQVKWTHKVLSDLARLYEFLAAVNRQTAALTVQMLTTAPKNLLMNPRIGEQLLEFEPREVRRIIVNRYEMRYEIQESTLYLLRLSHTREDR